MPPITLFTYLLSRLAVVFFAAVLALATVIMMADVIENIRFAEKYVDSSFAFAAQITMLRMPSLAQALSPFIVLFGALWTFSQFNRRSELAVMRSAGLSIWRIMGPAAFAAVLLGFFMVVAVDPMTSRLLEISEGLKNSVRGKDTNLLRVFGDGVWMRQFDNGGVVLINAANVDEAAGTLTDVTIWKMTADNRLEERIDAPLARLANRRIELIDPIMKRPGSTLPSKSPIYVFPTRLTAADFAEAAPPPETMSIWQLPRYILLAEATGLPTIRYTMRFHDLCSTPLKLLAMVLIAGVFSFRPNRQGGFLRLAALAAATGFGLYLLSEIAAALGESGTAPASLAAWTPALVASAFAISGLLHLEDG